MNSLIDLLLTLTGLRLILDVIGFGLLGLLALTALGVTAYAAATREHRHALAEQHRL